MPTQPLLRKMIVCTALIASTAYANDKPAPPAPPPPKAIDTWTGPDKPAHFFGGALIGGAVTAGTGKPLYGLAAGCGAGALKEFADRSTTGFSSKDLVVTCLGAGLGAYGVNWLITRQGGKTTVSYAREF